MKETSLELSVGCGRKSIPEKKTFDLINPHPFHALTVPLISNLNLPEKLDQVQG